MGKPSDETRVVKDVDKDVCLENLPKVELINRLQHFSDMIGEHLKTIDTLKDDKLELKRSLLSMDKLKDLLQLVEGGNSFIVPKEYIEAYDKKNAELAAIKKNLSTIDGSAISSDIYDKPLNITARLENLVTEYEKVTNTKIRELSYIYDLLNKIIKVKYS